jgi:hypothetical protein
MPQEMETEMNGVIAALLAKYDKLVHGDGTGVGGMGGASYKSFAVYIMQTFLRESVIT